jgi:hypothetical protein
VSEKSEIKRDKAKAQKNSGRGKIQKGDAIWRGFCVDYKEYTESYSVSRKSWGKICNDAWASGQLIPALKIILGSKEGYSKTRLAVIEWSELEELLDYKEKYEVLAAAEERRMNEIRWAVERSMKALEEDQEDRRREFG